MILGIIQARCSSKRLPGKVLAPLAERPLFAHVFERASAASKLDKVVLATSVDESDLPLVQAAELLGIPTHTGSLDDVLKRFYGVAQLYQPTSVVRITADCPLIDPAVLDGLIEFFLRRQLDYASNTIRPTFPDGLDCEIFTFAALEKAFHETSEPREREHVTPFFYEHPEIFKIGNYQQNEDLSDLRWTVDYPDDLEFVRRVYQALYSKNKLFHMEDVLALLEKHPEYQHTNKVHRRNEGFSKGSETNE